MKRKDLPPYYMGSTLNAPLPWYKKRGKPAYIVAAILFLVVALILTFWMKPWEGGFLKASANKAAVAAKTGTTGASTGATASADGKASAAGTDIKLAAGIIPGVAGVSGSNGSDGSDGSNGKDGSNTNTTVYVSTPNTTIVTVPGEPTTPITVPGHTPSTLINITPTTIAGTPTTTPIVNVVVTVPGVTTTTVKGVTPTTVAPAVNLLNVYAGLGNGTSLTDVQAKIGPLANLTSNVNVAGIRTVIYDATNTVGHHSLITLTFVNNALTAKVEVGL